MTEPIFTILRIFGCVLIAKNSYISHNANFQQNYKNCNFSLEFFRVLPIFPLFQDICVEHIVTATVEPFHPDPYEMTYWVIIIFCIWFHDKCTLA